MFYSVVAFLAKKENDLFAFKISYEDGVNPLYNGNISETFWRTESDDILRKYEYHYDDLNRLLEANYFKPGQGPAPNNYMEHLNYDKNGNITSLKRNGDLDSDGMMPEHLIDDLIYAYDPQKPNQLMKVTDDSNSTEGFKDGTNTGNDYAYDANGNMTSDQNKEITNIKYNHLNLPTKIIFGNGNQIIYLYNATGQKVSKKVEADAITTTDYLNGFQYTNAKLNFFPHAEGYVNVTEFKGRLNYNYVFNYTDHLGNIRLSYATDPTTATLKVIEENHYYPFGLKHTNYNSDRLTYVKREENLRIGQLIIAPILIDDVRGEYNYKYNGKEYQDELGLNVTAMDFRQYDPALGRFNGMDRLSESAYSVTPYRFAFNNPNFFNDPTGLIEESVIMDMFNRSGSGKTVWKNNGTDGFETANGGYVGYTSNFEGFNVSSGGNSSADFQLPAINVVGNSKTGYSDITINDAAINITANIYSSIFYEDEKDYLGDLTRLSLFFSASSMRLSTINRLHIGRPVIGATINFFGTNYIGNGNIYIKGNYLSKIGRGFGYAGFATGIVVDGIGVYNYIIDPNNPNAVHPAKAGTNTAIGAYGLTTAGALPSLLYFGVDALYPGGWTGDGQNPGALTNYGNTVQNYHSVTGKPFAYGSMK